MGCTSSVEGAPRSHPHNNIPPKPPKSTKAGTLGTSGSTSWSKAYSRSSGTHSPLDLSRQNSAQLRKYTPRTTAAVRLRDNYFAASQAERHAQTSGSRHQPTHTSPPEHVTVVSKTKDTNGFLRINQYSQVSVLGSGSFARCVQVIDRQTHKIYAMKTLHCPQASTFRTATSVSWPAILREMKIMRSVCHLNIVRLHASLVDAASRTVYLVMEYVEYGSVLPQSHNGTPLTEQRCLRYFVDLLNGVEYLHGLGIAHQDIKPENLLLDREGHIKISDFGCAVNVSKGRKRSGTGGFFSPALCAANGDSGCPFQNDIWAMGVTLYVFAYGTLPFRGDTLHETFQLIINQPLSFPTEVGPSEGLKNLLHRMLAKNPEERISLSEIRNHPWVQVAAGAKASTPLSARVTPTLSSCGEHTERNSGVLSHSNLSPRSGSDEWQGS